MYEVESRERGVYGLPCTVCVRYGMDDGDGHWKMLHVGIRPILNLSFDASLNLPRLPSA